MVTGLLLAAILAQAAPGPAAEGAAAAEVAWLAEPSTAVAYVLGEDVPPAPPEAPTPGWDGALPQAVFRGLFVTYRALLSSQDDGPCGFVPSCSTYSEQAIATYGLGEGLLLTADRLLRDHPLALGQYETDLATGLLRDPPSRYGLGGAR